MSRLAAAVAGILVLISGFLPWFRWELLIVAGETDAGGVWLSDAWHAGNAWPVALALSAGAAFLAISAGPLRLLTVLLATAGIVVTVVAWAAIPHTASNGDIYHLHRVHTYREADDLSWGFYAGLAAQLIAAGAVFAAYGKHRKG